MVGERVRDAFDREPIWRRVEDRIDDKASNLRNRPGKRLQKRFPQVPRRNFGDGIAVGTIEAAIAIILEDTVGIPFGSETEIVDSEPVNGGTLYTIDVDAPTENMARAKSFFEANVGFTSLLTDFLEVESVQVLRARPLRDTYQIKIKVVD